MKKKTKRAGIFTACAVTAAMVCAVAAPGVWAETDDYGVTDTQAVSSETVSQFNLASENWSEILGVTSETEQSETGSAVASQDETLGVVSALFGGNLRSDGGTSRLLIVAIIAFALGAVGITFFIYSQFIYKAKLRRKMEAEQEGVIAENYDTPGDNEELKMEPSPKTEPKHKAAPSKPEKDFFDDFEKQTKMDLSTPEETAKEPPEKPSEADNIGETGHSSKLTAEDEKKLNEVDWDDFFKKNE
ncbi:MAG: hypothetical protein PUC32_07970 [Oscillospiraceae bacterium]|nr:hypothetical protein [Oscillospiraceae bacterium]